eukprot:88198_1
MGCLFYNSPFVQYRWCLAGVSPAPCPPDNTVPHASHYTRYCHPRIIILYCGTIHYIFGFTFLILFLPPIASDCHTHNQTHWTQEQVDHNIHSIHSAMSYITVYFCLFLTHILYIIQEPMPCNVDVWLGPVMPHASASNRPVGRPDTKHQPPPSSFTSHYLIICHPNSSAQQVSSWVVHWMDSIQWYLEQSPATSLLCLAYLNVCLSECVKVAIYLRLTYSIIRITNPYSTISVYEKK